MKVEAARKRSFVNWKFCSWNWVICRDLSCFLLFWLLKIEVQLPSLIFRFHRKGITNCWREWAEMEKMNQAFEKMKMLVGMEVDEEQPAVPEESSSFSFIDDFNRQCTLSTKQVFFVSLYSSFFILFVLLFLSIVLSQLFLNRSLCFYYLRL